MRIYTCVGTSAHHIINMYVVELGDELILGIGSCCPRPTRRSIYIVTLEDYRLGGNISHNNI